MTYAEEYAATLEKMLIKLQTITQFQNRAETQPALEDICRFLRIGRVHVRYFPTQMHERQGNGMEALMYDSGNADENLDHAIVERHMIENGSVAIYTFSAVNGEADWTEVEREKIQVIHHVLFTYHGRASLSTIAHNLTFNDMTLNIPNLTFYMKQVGEKIGRGTIGEYGTSYFNLRRFSVVNNQVGRDEGTAIMKKYLHGLQGLLSDEEYVCRVGGDNFVTLFKKEHLDAVMEYFRGASIQSEHHFSRFVISASAGIYMIDASECRSPMDVMDKAAIVANIAKKNAASPFVFYNKDIQENVRMSKKIENMIPDALRKEEFLIYYQPKVSLKDYTLVGAEALCRWRHGDEMIQPFRFIPVLERSKLVCELDYYMLDHVCRDIRRWLDEGKNVVKISVNFSRMHLGNANLLEDIIGIIDRHHVPHEYIQVELTETTTDVDYGELKRVVAGLHAADIETAVDDFGVGYSSLNLIRELPWNVLKIDKSFLPDGTGNEKQKKTMLKYVIAMAQELGLRCIVEGVETIEHVMLLKECNCFYVQGFYFDRPLPVAEFETRFETRRKV